MPFRFNTLLGRLISLQILSRNAAECSEPRCQVCTFIAATEDSVVRAASVQDIRNLSHLPFTTRSAWYEVQAECPDLRRTHAHLKQGTRPSKKATNINDVKRYLNVASIAKDGLLGRTTYRPSFPHYGIDCCSTQCPRWSYNSSPRQTGPSHYASIESCYETPFLCSRYDESH